MPSLLDEVHAQERLDSWFEDLRQHLGDPQALNPARSDPIFYLVYAPADTLRVRRLLPGWIARLHVQDGLTVEKLSLSEVVWQIIDTSGRWDEWLEVEADFGLKDQNNSIRSVLRNNNAFVAEVATQVVHERPSTVLFVTDVECLHPYFRTRAIESYLNNKVRIPTVIFYPGSRVGQYGLKFLGIYPEDSGYRSPIFGGLE